jgi:RNA polymerase sigma factor (sigma-70 family)
MPRIYKGLIYIKELIKLILEENWQKIKERVISPLWHRKFKSMYENAKLDYADFESLAGIELAKAIKTFDPEKANIYTYATRVISQKAKTELRNCTQRDKRKALYTADSIDVPNSPVINKPVEEKLEISEISELRVGNFINSLNNNQLRILILTLLGFDSTDMPNMLNMSNQTMQSITNSLKNADLTRTLYRRKF